MRHLLLSLPFGILYFVALVVGISLGLSLTIVWIGIPILLQTLALMDGMVDLELRMAERWLGVARPPSRPSPAGQERVEHLQTVVRGPGFWSSLGFLLLKLPLGIFSFTLVISLVSVSLALVMMPVVYFLSTIFHFTLVSGFWEINSWTGAILCVFPGLGLAWVSSQVIAVLAEAWRQLVRHRLRPLQ